ncbi:MAG: acylneuraminate cytidylyltransferase family protein [Candidatus Melainabacteria bacterium]
MTRSSQHLAIIPARGGSKRIPRKNVTDFMGRPMIAWTIKAALDSGRFAHVLVSTEDEEIADTARKAGAEVPFLRQVAADDQAHCDEATYHALLQAEAYYGQSFETVCQLMANCPLRTASDIRAAYAQFEAAETAFQVSCFAYGWMNPWWAMKTLPEHRREFLFPGALKQRSQDLAPLSCPTGAIWIARTAAFKDQKSFYGDTTTFCEMDWRSAVDIDEPGDMAFAQAVFAMRRTPAGTGS